MGSLHEKKPLAHVAAAKAVSVSVCRDFVEAVGKSNGKRKKATTPGCGISKTQTQNKQLSKMGVTGRCIDDLPQCTSMPCWEKGMILPEIDVKASRLCI